MESEYVRRNRASWNRKSAEYQRRHGGQLSTKTPTWGVWSIREDELHVLGEVAGKDVLELGCGGAQWSICLARRGARVTGLDFSAEQLLHARRLVDEAGVDVRLVQGDAEQLDLPPASFDIVFCDHGAMSFCDPRAVVPRVARVLCPGGLFAFNISTPLHDLCWPVGQEQATDRLAVPYPQLGLIDEGDEACFQLTYGDWIRLFVANGLRLVDLVELLAPENPDTTYDYATVEWASRWPAEHIWKLVREG